MNIEIFVEYDDYDCEQCGLEYATGGRVLIDGEEVIDEPAVAHCFGSTMYSEFDLLVMALEEKGISVEVEYDESNL